MPGIVRHIYIYIYMNTYREKYIANMSKYPHSQLHMRNKDFDKVNFKDHTNIHSKSGILTQDWMI